MKVEYLTGPAIDWAVAKAGELDEDYVLAGDQFVLLHDEDGSGLY